MAKNPTPQQAVEAARRAHDARLDAVRALAEARQNVADVREASVRAIEAAKAKAIADTNAAELADVAAWDKALRAGWQVAELRRIGFHESEKKARARRRRTTGARTATPVGHGTVEPDDGGVVDERPAGTANLPAAEPQGADHD